MDDIKEVEGRMKGLVIESPPFLDPTANFFSQDPFERIVKTISRVTSVPEHTLHLMLTFVAKELEKFLDGDEIPDEAIGRAITYSIGTPKPGLKGDYWQKLKPGQAMVAALKKYPYWRSYISTQLGGKYRSSGQVDPTAKSPPVESYGYWVTKKLVREGRLKMKGMEEIFGENLEGRPPAEFMSGSRASRRWEILSAAEITRKK